MIKITQVIQKRIPNTSLVVLDSIHRFNQPFETLEEYIELMYPDQKLAYCEHSKRYTVETPTDRTFISLSEEFGSHWIKRKIDLGESNNFVPFVVTSLC